VHAHGQVASASLERAIEPATLARAANARLPPAIRVIQVSDAPAGFHARFNARAKSYRYRISNVDVISPFERAYAWHVAGPALDLETMADAAASLEGTHDFAAFQAAGGESHGSIRTVFTSRVHGRPQGLIEYDISGNGFLRHMVRNIVGTLVEAGRGRRSAEWVKDVLASRDRGQAGPTAPAQGLFLMAVEYG
jgi:tRNA pseudouridine38-40 synthase